MIRGELDAQPTPRERALTLAERQLSEWHALIASLPRDDRSRLMAEGLQHVLHSLISSERARS